MGNTKFKLSNMIPNAWFYMLKDMNKSSKFSSKVLKKQQHPPPPAPPSSPPIIFVEPPPQQPQPEPQCEATSRKSYHISRELPLSPPRKSKSSTKSRKSTRRSSSISSCSCKSTTRHSHHSKSLSNSSTSPPIKETDDDVVSFFVEDALLTTRQKKQSILDNVLPNKYSAEQFDIIIDVDKKSLLTNNNINKFNFQLPPINTKQKTKPKNINKENKIKTNNHQISKENKHSPPTSRRFSVSSPGGVRLKMNSPRINARKQGQNSNYTCGRRSTSSKKTKKSITESFAVVKSSSNPQKDFKESMVEMIVQNNLRASKDLEDLLACYLSLNSDEYHEVIIKVFKQIWFDFRHG